MSTGFNIIRNLSVKAKILSGFLILALLTGLTGAIGGWTASKIGDEGVYVAERLAPLGDAAMEIKLSATRAHLIFEEIMAGDEGEDINVVWELLDETLFYANAILNGAENDEGRFYASEDPGVREKMEDLVVRIGEFVEVARVRHGALASGPGVGSGADERFDGLYDALITGIVKGADSGFVANSAEAQRLAGAARYSLANGHLLLEEILSGDEGEDLAEAIGNFSSAQAMVAELGERFSMAGAPELLIAIEELIALTNQRYQSSQVNSGAGSEADEKFDQSFETMIDDADVAEELIHKAMGDGIAELRAENRQGLILIVGFTTLSFVVAIVLALLIGRNVSGRIGSLAGVMQKLAADDFSVGVPYAADQDEIGAMAGTVEVFKQNGVKAKELAAAEQKEQEVRSRRAKQIESFCTGFDEKANTVLRAVAAACEQMRSVAQKMSGIAEETATQAKVVTGAAEEASSNVQTAASGAEELSSSIGEISRQVAQSNEYTGKAVNETENITTRVKGLDEAAQKIGEVIGLISDIAEQTNLLALNATIEAARAGEAGKGFAVVAGEVKSLATQTAKATEEISKQIGGMQDATGAAVGAIEGIRGIIASINENASAIAAAVEEQNAATNEIARNVQQAAAGTSDVSANIGGVNEGAAQTGTAASEVLSAADALTTQADELQREVHQFLESVRAA
jgi:methyl-accepting chemotaxis protein